MTRGALIITNTIFGGFLIINVDILGPKGTLERNPVENCSGPYIISVRSGRAFPRSLSPGERRALLSWAGVGPTVGLWVQGLGLRV